MKGRLAHKPHLFFFSVCLVTALCVSLASRGVNGEETPSGEENSEAIQQLESILALPTRFDRQSALFQFVSTANTPTLNALLSYSVSMAAKRLQKDVQEIVLLRLASLDPKSALSQIESLPEDQQIGLTRVIYQEWSLSNLNQAVAHAKGLDELSREAAFEGIWESRIDLTPDQRLEIAAQLDCLELVNDLMDEELAGLVVDNPDEALDEYLKDNEDDLHIGGSQVYLFEHISRALLDRHGTEAALRIVDRKMRGHPSRHRILVVFFGEVAKEEPDLAFELAMGMRQKDDEILASVRILGWADTDPVGALKSSMSIQDKKLRARVLSGLSLSPAPIQIPVQILEALGSSLGDADENLVSRSLTALAGKSPESAVQYLDRIDDSAYRLRVAERVVRIWAQQDARSALDWINAQENTQGYRQNLLPIAMKELVYEDPLLAFQAALEIPDQRDRVGSEARVIEEIAKFDTELAISMLPRTRNEQTKLHAARAVGETLIQDGDSVGAKEIAELLPQSDRTVYFMRLIGPWISHAPRELYELIPDLPTDRVKSHAANELLNPFQNLTFNIDEQEKLQSYSLSSRDLDKELSNFFLYSRDSEYINLMRQ